MTSNNKIVWAATLGLAVRSVIDVRELLSACLYRDELAREHRTHTRVRFVASDEEALQWFASATAKDSR